MKKIALSILCLLAFTSSAHAYDNAAVTFTVTAVTTSVEGAYVGIRVSPATGKNPNGPTACYADGNDRFHLSLSDPAADSFREIMIAAFLSGSTVEISWDNDVCEGGKPRPGYFKIVAP